MKRSLLYSFFVMVVLLAFSTAHAQLANDAKDLDGELFAKQGEVVLSVDGSASNLTLTGNTDIDFPLTMGEHFSVSQEDTPTGAFAYSIGLSGSAPNGGTRILFSDWDGSNNFIRLLVADNNVFEVDASGNVKFGNVFTVNEFGTVHIGDPENRFWSLDPSGIMYGSVADGAPDTTLLGLGVDASGGAWLSDGNGDVSIDIGERGLLNVSGDTVVDWQDRALNGQWKTTGIASNEDELVSFKIATNLIAAAVGAIEAGQTVYAGSHTLTGATRAVTIDLMSNAVVSLTFSEDVGEIAVPQLTAVSLTNFSYVVRNASGVMTNGIAVNWIAHSPNEP